MKTSNTKKRFLLSLIAVIACVAMLIGTTFAWFTDSVSNTGNKIQAGTLKVDLLMDKQAQHTAESYVSIKDEPGAVFMSGEGTGLLWEPGQTQYAYLATANKGNLALKYNIVLDITDKETNEDLTQAMAGAFTYAIVNTKHEMPTTTFENWGDVIGTEGAITGNLLEAIQTATADATAKSGRITAAEDGKLLPGEKDYFAVVIHMNEEAGNAYQNGLIEIDVNLVATQLTYEEDGFGSDQYDLSAQLPVVAAFPVIKKGDLNTDKTVKIEEKGAIKSAEVPAKGTATVFNELKKDETTFSNDLTLTLNVNELANKEKDIDAGKERTIDLDINMSAVMTSTNVTTKEVTNQKQEKVEALTEFTTIEMNIGTGYSAVKVLHKGEEMELLDNATDTPEDTINGGYFYSATDGILTLKTMTFSPFTIQITQPHIWGDYTSNNDGTHDAVCQNDRTHILENEPCDTDGPDGACSKCGYKKVLGKGSIMHMDVNGDKTTEDFLVLKKNDDQVEIMAQSAFVAYDGGTTWGFSDQSVGARFSKSVVGTYLNGTDTTVKIQKNNTVYATAIYCTTYYGNLSKDVKDAIVTQEKIQYKYNIPTTKPISGEYYTSVGDKYTYWFEKKQEGFNDSETTSPFNKFNVYVLGIEDIAEYLGKDNITAANLKKMFGNTNKRIWLNTQLDTNKQNGAEKGNISYLYYSNGDFNSTMPNGGHDIYCYSMPVMTLDLTELPDGFYTFD